MCGPGLAADAGVTWVTVSNMPLAQIEAYKAQMGWTLPFVSSHGTTFAADCGAGGGFMLSVFLSDGADVYRTYSTTARGWTGWCSAQHPRPVPVRAAGGLGGFPVRLAAASHL